MSEAPRSNTMSWIWGAAVVGALLALAAVGAWLYRDLYVPRHPTLAEAIEAGDAADVARFVRSDPALADAEEYGLEPWTLLDLRLNQTENWEKWINASGAPLGYALTLGDIDSARALLEQGADPNLRRHEERTPFESVFALPPGEQRNAWVALMLEHGADASARTADGTTPLLMALADGDTELLEALLAHGADPNAADARGMTPLALAVLAGALESAQTLLAHGAEIDRRLGASPAAASVSASAASPTFPATPAPVTGHDYTTLHMAILQHAPREVIGWLLDHGADPDAPGRVPVFGGVLLARGAADIAWRTGDWDAFALLAQRGATLPAHRPNAAGQTPLHWAVMRRDPATARLLLAAGADPHHADPDGQTPAQLAAESSNAEVRALFEDE